MNNVRCFANASPGNLFTTLHFLHNLLICPIILYVSPCKAFPADCIVSSLVNFNVCDIFNALIQFVLTNAALSMAWWGNSLIPNRAKLFGIKHRNWQNRQNLLGMVEANHRYI
jgi:hypothetical protein